MDDGGIGAAPLRKSGSITSWGIPKRDVGDNLEEVVAQFRKVRLEVVLDVDDESRCDCGEQTRLKKTSTARSRWSYGEYTHEDQRGVQVFVVLLHEVAVILVRFALELVVELDTGAAGRSKEVWEEGW